LDNFVPNYFVRRPTHPARGLSSHLFRAFAPAGRFFFTAAEREGGRDRRERKRDRLTDRQTES